METKSVDVKMSFTVTVNVNGWCEAYGTTPGQVRKDVQQYLLDAIENIQPEGFIKLK